MKKIRLDVAVVERGLSNSRSSAKNIILAGDIMVNGHRMFKPGTMISTDAKIELIAPMPYVSRGGLKLEGALQAFGVSIEGWVCADVGACTGGFTDVLLQRGARRIYAIDVGHGQLDWTIRNDDRVVVMERINARYLEELPEKVQLVSIDVSFISLKLILPAVRKWLVDNGSVVTLIKPQFEAQKKDVGKGGVIRDDAVRRKVVESLTGWMMANGWVINGLIRSPIKGASGNVEYFAYLQPGDNQLHDTSDLLDGLFQTEVDSRLE